MFPRKLLRAIVCDAKKLLGCYELILSPSGLEAFDSLRPILELPVRGSGQTRLAVDCFSFFFRRVDLTFTSNTNIQRISYTLEEGSKGEDHRRC